MFLNKEERNRKTYIVALNKMVRKNEKEELMMGSDEKRIMRLMITKDRNKHHNCMHKAINSQKT